MPGGIQAALGVAILLAGAVAAQEQRPLREARSSNENYLLRIEPGRSGRVGRSCSATLYALSGPPQPRRRVWERPLVNDVAPGRALVRDDGRFVVTLDEFQRGGARHALVVYGAAGELLRHFLLSDLLDARDWPHVQAAGRALEWLGGARLSFEAAADVFRIEMSWGRTIRVDLRTLQVVRPDAETARGDLTTVPAELRAVLLGPFADPASPSVEPAAELAALTPVEQAQADAIAQQLLASGEDAVAQEELHVGGPSDETAAQEQTLAVEPEPVAQQLRRDGIAVPAPNPVEKVDYVAWLNDLGRVDGPDAAPVYDEARERFVPWSGSEVLLRAAEGGDPDALASAEIGAWLEANAGALARFREAARLPQRGWQYASSDGSMIGVLLPNLAPLRALARAAILQGRRLALEGQGEAGVESILDALSASEHVGSGLTLIENLVGVAVQSVGAEALLDVQAGAAGRALDYTPLVAATAAAARALRPPGEALQGERAAFMDTLQRVWNVDEQGEYVLDRAAVRQFLAYVSDDAGQLDTLVEQFANAGYESTLTEGTLYYDALEDALARPYPEAAVQLHKLETLLEESESCNPFLRALTPSVGRYLFIRARGESYRRAAVLVTELHAYRQRFGHYPEALDTVGQPDLVADPFSGATFVYRRDGDDFHLYSVGGNGRDDGGVHDRKGESNDLVFWPRPR